MEKIIVTGCSGFIGFHLCKSLLEDGYSVLGIDNMNDYYSVKLKQDRLKILKKNKSFQFSLLDISDNEKLFKAFEHFKPQKVVNLAAQAGVRYSLKDPHAYVESNISGFMNILAYIIFLSTKSAVVVFSSNTNLYSVIPSLDCVSRNTLSA